MESKRIQPDQAADSSDAVLSGIGSKVALELWSWGARPPLHLRRGRGYSRGAAVGARAALNAHGRLSV
jgi:hypothetical protein